MIISLIWAMGKNREIGYKNRLPWHITEDLRHFKKATYKKPVIMGFKTYKSIGKPLPGRRNIVLSRKKQSIEGCETASSINEAIRLANGEKECFVIGGASVYKQFLKIADRLYITYIDSKFKADAFFPEFDMSQWKLVSEKKGLNKEKLPYDYYFRVYERIKEKAKG